MKDLVAPVADGQAERRNACWACSAWCSFRPIVPRKLLNDHRQC